MIRKPGKLDDSPSSFRSICLLNDLGKILERIIAGRLLNYLRSLPNSGMNPNQFGFRVGKSTCDAILQTRQIIDGYTLEGKYCAAISMDIKNAFNSLPWNCIVAALENKDVPFYIVDIIKDYLSNRSAVKGNGYAKSYQMSCGVPQGSVLGPLLWIITCDDILNVGLPRGAHSICFADDTLLIVASESLESLRLKANLVCEIVVQHIRGLGLEISPSKTEAPLFCPSKVRSLPFCISVDSVSIETKKSMRYLGVIVDDRWRFSEHLKTVALKALKRNF